MPTLRQRRQVARLKKRGRKTFNMHWIVDTIDQVITELSEYAGREPEIDAAIEVALSLKKLISAYSDRTINTPYRSAKFNPEEFRDWSQGVLNSLGVRLEQVEATLVGHDKLLDKIADDSEDYYHDGILSDEGLEQIQDVQESYDILVNALDEATNTVWSERGILGATPLRSRRGRARRRFFRKKRR